MLDDVVDLPNVTLALVLASGGYVSVILRNGGRNHIARSNCRGGLSGAGVACFGHGDNCNRPKGLDLMLGAGVGIQL